MDFLQLFLTLLFAMPWTRGYNTRAQASGYSSYASLSSASSSSSSASSSYGGQSCCQLSPWAQDHMAEVRQLANRLRQEYQSMSRGSSTAYSTTYLPTSWSADIVDLTGKTASELDAICRRLSEQLVTDLRKGQISYNTIAQPNFFESKAAETLQMYGNLEVGGQQQQQVLEYEHYHPIDLTNFDDMKNYAFPSEIKIIDGKTYLVHTNCTEGSRIMGEASPFKALSRNHSTISSHAAPMMATSYGSNRMFSSSGAMMSGGSYPPVSRQQATVYDWINKNREPAVIAYQPVVTVNAPEWNAPMNNYRPPSVHIPVEAGPDMVESIDASAVSPPRSSVTVRRYNKTIIRHPDGSNVISGSEINRKWVDGRLVYDSQRPLLPPPSVESLQLNERERLDELIRQHNATMDQLQSSIKSDQQKLHELSQTYRGNVQDMEAWLKAELSRLGGIIDEQRNEMSRITVWQRSERERLENILGSHRGSLQELEAQTQRDRAYIQSLAAKYHVSIEELEKWQRSELERLYSDGQSKLEMNLKAWQRQEREHLIGIIKKNDLTIEEFEQKIMNDRARLEDLAKTYKIQVSEVEDWIKHEINSFQSQGLLKEVQQELALWQQKERDRLLAIVQQSELTVEELEKKIKADQSHMYALASTYHVRVEEVEAWLKQELMRLQGEGLVKVADLKDWQKSERDEILKVVQQNKFTIEDFEQKLLNDRQRLQALSDTYNVQLSEIESWIKQEGERLQDIGLLHIQEQLNNWQSIERDRLLQLIQRNNYSIGELEERINSDQVHLYSLAHQHQVRVEEIEEWIRKEIKKLHADGLLAMEKLKDWQTEWRGNLTDLVQERDFTVDEFHKWLLEDRTRLQALAMQHNVQIEEIEQWIANEEQRFISMGLLKPNEKLTNWQEVERRYLERVTQEQFHSTEQLEQRLRQDRQLLEQLAGDYSVQVEEIERWMKKELSRLRDEGQLQISNMTSWQIAERERLEELIRLNKEWSVAELEAVLRKDREHLQKMAFQYHTSVEEVEQWVRAEIERLGAQGQSDIAKLTAWQRAEQERIMQLLQQKSNITLEEFERKVQLDRSFLTQLSDEYHVSVLEVEQYVRQVIDELRDKGRFEVGNLQAWQTEERERIKQLLRQQNAAPTTEFETKLLADRAHLRRLAAQYRIDVEQLESWMVEELQRLRHDTETQVQQLSAWQLAELQRVRDLIRQNQRLSYVEFEMELTREHSRLQGLAREHSVSVDQIENWLRQQLLNLKTSGQVQVENLAHWQEVEQRRLIEMLLQRPRNLTLDEFEQQLRRDRQRLQQLAQQYSLSVEQMERWMRDELQRLQNSGLLQVEQLTAWQRMERQHLEDWLKGQNKAATAEEFNEFLKRDRQRLQKMAHDYHVTVEEVEQWVRQEATRLQILGLMQRPEKMVVYVDNYATPDAMWKVQTRAHLQAIARLKTMTWPDFERYLRDERPRWMQFARQYNVSVEDIEMWLRESATTLANQGMIRAAATAGDDWMRSERLHIERLIDEKQQQWSIEELARHLRNDREHLQRIAMQNRIASIEVVVSWYDGELQRLLEAQRIVSEHLVDWQRREKARIYSIVERQPALTTQQLERQLLADKLMLNQLADEYHVNIEELEFWIRNELRRLLNLGLLKDMSATAYYNRWQQDERERLRAIAAELLITDEELLEFIAGDYAYQSQLARMYGCAVDELAPFQRIEIGVMEREGLFDQRPLLRVEPWQRRERDRLYSLVKSQNFNAKNLRDWQRQDVFLSDLAAKYGLRAATLKDWQTEEYERLLRLARRCHMTLLQLQDFRDKESRYMAWVMHKRTSMEAERISWGANEAKRMEMLEERAGLSGEELLAWRRRLYLLCQGRIAMDESFRGADDGYERGVGSTNRTAPPHQLISKDRGDQPPNVYEENVDSDEPGVAGQETFQMRVVETTLRPPARIPMDDGGIKSGYRYTKKEYKFSVPPVATMSSSSSSSSSSSLNSYQHGGAASNFGHRHSRSEEPKHPRHGSHEDDGGQQQQQVMAEDLKDFGQQQIQAETLWSGSSAIDDKDPGQQQAQIDEEWNRRLPNAERTVDADQQQQQQQQEQQQLLLDDVEEHESEQRQRQRQRQRQFIGAVSQEPSQKDIVSTGPTMTKEVEAKSVNESESETPGFWNKLKKKTSDFFG